MAPLLSQETDMQKITHIAKLDPAYFLSGADTPDRAFRLVLKDGFTWACFWDTKRPEEGVEFAVIARGKDGGWVYSEDVPELKGFHLIFEPKTFPRKDFSLAETREWLQHEFF